MLQVYLVFMHKSWKRTCKSGEYKTNGDLHLHRSLPPRQRSSCTCGRFFHGDLERGESCSQDGQFHCPNTRNGIPPSTKIQSKKVLFNILENQVNSKKIKCILVIIILFYEDSPDDNNIILNVIDNGHYETDRLGLLVGVFNYPCLDI